MRSNDSGLSDGGSGWGDDVISVAGRDSDDSNRGNNWGMNVENDSGDAVDIS